MKRPERSTSSAAFSSSGQSASVCALDVDHRNLAAQREHLFDFARDARAEVLERETRGVRANGGGVELGLEVLERAHGVGQRLWSRLGEVHAGRRAAARIARADDRLQRPAARERDHRPAGGLRLDRDDPEVLVLRVHQRPTARVELVELAVRDPAEEAHVRGRARLEPRAGRAVACDHQRLAERAERLDRQRLGLVRHEAAEHEVVVLGRRAQLGEARDVDSGIHHAGGAVPDALDPLLDRVRDRDDPLDPARRAGAQVPAAQVREQGRRGEPARAGAEILVREIPRVADRRHAVTEMGRAGRHPHALRERVAVRDHEVVALEPEALDRQREERQELPVVPRRAGQPRQRARVDVERVDPLARAPGYMDQRIEVGRGEHAGELVQDLLAPAKAREPILDQRDAHRARA